MKERIIVHIPIEDRKIAEIYAEAVIRAGVTLREAAEAISKAIYYIFAEAADQFEAFDAALKAVTTVGAAELVEPQEQAKGPRPHPCPDAGPLRPPKSTRAAYTACVQRIRPQARSAIKQRRNRRRE